MFKWLQVIDFDLPITVKLKVVEVDPGLRGDTAQGIFSFLLISWNKNINVVEILCKCTLYVMEIARSRINVIELSM